MKLSKLINANEYIRVAGDLQCDISTITTDVESTAAGALLIITKDSIITNAIDLDRRFLAIICTEKIFEELLGK